MYAQPAFRMDRSACLAFAAARGFGTIVAFDGVRPVASLLPFIVAYADDGTPRVEFHVARENPLAVCAAQQAQILIVVSTADAYVSPDWYASRDQVPTWLYETVQLSGRARLMPPEKTGAHVDRLSQNFEARLTGKPPWTSGNLTPARRQAMLKAICAIEVDVDAIEGSAKLNQHKSDADQLAVAAQLGASGNPMDRAIAARMVALRPELSYELAMKDSPNG